MKAQLIHMGVASADLEKVRGKAHYSQSSLSVKRGELAYWGLVPRVSNRKLEDSYPSIAFECGGIQALGALRRAKN